MDRTLVLGDARLLEFARRLESVSTFEALLDELLSEIRESTGYLTAWVSVLDAEGENMRVLGTTGERSDDFWAHSAVVPLANDPYVQGLVQSSGPVVIEDAQVDPTVNRQIVSALGNRTIINVPMRLIDFPFGVVGTGTFGDEGVRLPTDDELTYLTRVSQHVVVTSARLLLSKQREEAVRQKAEFDLALARRQRLESLGQLAGGVAHDFNNLLTVILASTSMLRENETDPARAEELSMIEEAARRAAELTTSLLAMGQRQSLHIDAQDANQLLRTTIAALSAVVPNSISIDLIEGRRLPSILADEGHIQQVFTNLCLNARDAMPSGGRLTVESEHVVINGEFVRAHPWANPGRYVLISITDTGVGMSPVLLERIFEPFFTTKEEGQGSGLGLAVCKGIVEQHGGLLHAYSELGMGSTFKVYLPISTRAARDVGSKLDGPVPSGRERILVADDQVYVRRVIERILKRAGYQVSAVGDGAEAVALVRREHFDLVILDAVMPVMGGREAYEQIRQSHPALPVLFASGYGAEEITTRFLGDMAVPLLPKPFDPDTLLRTVRRLLGLAVDSD